MTRAKTGARIEHGQHEMYSRSSKENIRLCCWFRGWYRAEDDEMICSPTWPLTPDGVIGTAHCSFPLPTAIKEKVQSGMEQDADDAVFGSTNSKQKVVL